jgi:hypothetical protein
MTRPRLRLALLCGDGGELQSTGDDLCLMGKGAS